MRLRSALLVFGLLVLWVGASQAMATNTYQWTNEPTKWVDPTGVMGVGVTPSWWGTVGDNTISADLVVGAVDGVYTGQGVAPTWWVGNPLSSTGWEWGMDVDSGGNRNLDKTWLRISNRANEKLYKEVVLWWTPDRLQDANANSHTWLEYKDASGAWVNAGFGEFQWNWNKNTAFKRWVLPKQPSEERIVWQDSASPLCNVYVGTNCAPEPASLVLLGCAAGAGAWVRRRRNRK